MFQRIAFYLLLILALLGVTSCGKQREVETERLVVWVNSNATTPVLPIYAAGVPNLDFQDWNTAMAFQSLLLAGDGIFWVGHVEGLARAAEHGAPVKLLAVTGWRKWQVLSKLESDVFPESFVGQQIPLAPADGAGRFLLESLLKEQGVKVGIQPMDAKPLLLKVLDGQYDSVILPEPFATMLVNKNMGFHRIGSIEEYYGRCRNCPPEVPWAGIAVNADWAKDHKVETEEILMKIVEAGERLSKLSPEEASGYWPEGKSGVSRSALAESLVRDPVQVVPAREVSSRIREFLAVVAPGVPCNEDLFW